MSTITINISEEISPTYIAKPWITLDTSCIRQYDINVLVPGANLFVEVISSSAHAFGLVTEEEISGNKTYVFGVDAWKSSISSSNTESSTVTLRVRSSAGGTVLAQIILNRDHTINIC